MVKAVIFDLDGVLVSTDELHYEAWKQLGEELGINNFTKEDNLRQRGVSRMKSLDVLLEKTDRVYTEEEKEHLAERKNEKYVAALDTLTPEAILPGVMPFLTFLKEKQIRIGVGSSSKNAPLILDKIGLRTYFDAVSSGWDTDHSKPDPDIFLIAAQKLGIPRKNVLSSKMRMPESRQPGVPVCMRLRWVRQKTTKRQLMAHALWRHSLTERWSCLMRKHFALRKTDSTKAELPGMETNS